MEITPDNIKIFTIGPVTINATIFLTWIVMALLTAGSWLITRRLSPDVNLSHGQNLLEVIVEGVNSQIREISRQESEVYLPFIGTFFLYIATSNLLGVVPYFHPPTASLSTTAALAVCVFIMVPVFGIREEGVGAYLRHYTKPSIIMLPFHVISEFSRTLALAVRLFGNIMSGALIAGLLLAIIPFFFPVIIHFLELITGLVQAYIFAVLAMVYIASNMTARKREKRVSKAPETGQA